MIKHLKGLEINSIYDFDNAFSINELLCKFWEKIEETINISNESIDILNWLKEEGLPDEVQVVINQLVADGTIEQMINVDKIEELRTSIEELSSQLDNNTSVTNYSIYSTNKENRKTIILGHRGLMTYYPENTLMAFKNCVLSGFCDGFELDVRESSDKVLYCLHDTTVDRTTNGTGAIKDLTSSYINTLDASCKFDFHFPNVGVPTFDRVVKESSRYKPIIMCHIFPGDYSTIEESTDYIKRVIDIIKKYDMESYCYLTIESNSKTYYPIVRKFSKKIRLNISTNSGFNQDDGYYSLRDYYKEIKDPNIILSTIYDFWVNNPQCIEELHLYNIGVGCDNPKTYARLQDLLYRGFDVICSDNMSKGLI